MLHLQLGWVEKEKIAVQSAHTQQYSNWNTSHLQNFKKIVLKNFEIEIETKLKASHHNKFQCVIQLRSLSLNVQFVNLAEQHQTSRSGEFTLVACWEHFCSMILYLFQGDSSKDAQLTAMLLLVTTCFLIFTSPQYIRYILFANYDIYRDIETFTRLSILY